MKVFRMLMLLTFSAIVILYVTCAYFTDISSQRADSIELQQTFDRWTEAGCPYGEDLEQFILGRRKDLVVTNRQLRLNGTNFVSIFALTNLHGRSGILFATTNGSLIWIDEIGRARALSRPGPR